MRRVLGVAGELREAGFGVARGLVAVAFVSLVLVFALRYENEPTKGAGVVVKPPSFISVPVAPPAPTPPPPPLAVADAGDAAVGGRGWYLRQAVDIRQEFSAAGRGAEALCSDLATSGFTQAAWAESGVFPGEWECSSPATGTGEVLDAFLIVRGRGREAAGSVMLKLNVEASQAQAPFRAMVDNVLARFAAASGVELDPAIAARLREWQTGTFKHGFQTLRLVKQYGRAEPNAVHFAILPFLPRPTEGSCGRDCFPLKPPAPRNETSAGGGMAER